MPGTINKMKKCSICGKSMQADHFYFSGRFRQPCKDCLRQKRQTMEGVLYQRWRGIVQRCEGIGGHYTTAIGKEHISHQEFMAWANSSQKFRSLYKTWNDNNYEQNLAPSIDRVDVSKGYIIPNMQWITMRENNSKAEQDHLAAFGKTFKFSRKVRLWKETGEQLFFDSAKAAARYFEKNRLAVVNNIITGHKICGWSCEYITKGANRTRHCSNAENKNGG